MSRDPGPSVTRLDSAQTRSSDVESSAFDEGGFTPGTLLLGRYRIVGLIGRGGMGEVYRAQDLRLGQTVALKFLPEAMDHDRSRLDRFLAEVRIARQISHPHVCRVYDVADVDGRHFLSMEFVDGEDLASLLRRIGRLPPDKGVETARQICAGLAAAHDRGVLHRDLKPANIMIDGRGRARLADFGLAAAAEDVRDGELAGTPAYMAPEQLDGGEISVKTDLYALGLVLHEIFTGQRLSEGASLQELRALRRDRSTTESSLNSSSTELDPAITRVIRRCLEPDPNQRPASALSVAAALPGGDPLAAALAAGETPSPELVAGAGAVGALRPVAAWMLLAGFVVGLVVTAWFASFDRFFRFAPNMRSPDVLASRAQDFLATLGYGSERGDTAYGWRLDDAATRYVRDSDRRRDRWERLAESDAPALEFWFRANPSAFVPYDFSGNVTATDPPMLTVGMASVTLTSRGRLIAFEAVPPRETDLGRTADEPDWSPFFTEAGLDVRTFSAVDPRTPPPMFADRRVAWDGPDPRRPEWMLHVEAAALGVRPVFFSVAFPWTVGQELDTGDRTSDALGMLRQFVQLGLRAATLILGIWLARANIRAGRADTRGAFIVATATAAPLLVNWLLGADHVPSPAIEWGRFAVFTGEALLLALQLWLVYLAIEPYVRRRWPEALISWTRLLAGRFRDPLVGRDVLIGLVVGVALIVSGAMIDSLPEWLGQPPLTPGGGNELSALGSAGEFVARLALRGTRVMSESLLILFVLLLWLIVLRNRWLAYAAMTLTFVALAVNQEAVLLSVVTVVVFVTAVVALISRAGLLAYLAMSFAYFSLNELPLTLDPSAWFAARSAVVAAMLLVVAGWAFYVALGDRSIFGSAFES